MKYSAKPSPPTSPFLFISNVVWGQGNYLESGSKICLKERVEL